jgi:hypothetical protein
MKWYLICNKPDDYGACLRSLVKCKKSDLKYVYYFDEVPEEDLETLKKYFDIVNDFLDEGEKIKDYLEKYFCW